MSFVEIIARKRDGLTLSRQQVAEFVRGASDGSIAAEQLAALLMAICCRGMNADETAWLTGEMLASGESWNLASDCPGVVDKHSTGGVGDTVSLILAPLLAAVGVPVAMMAGRGLGHSQGTLDKLETIPGFQVHWDRAGALDLIGSCGAAMVAQTESIAPADRTLYALRDVTGTVPSLPLIVGSIMSKKLALGAAALVLDVKWGRGAFRKTVADAAELASALRQVARDHGRAAEALITDMNQPLGCALGTASEARAAWEVLAGGGDAMLRQVTLDLCLQAMVLVGHDRETAGEELEKALSNGSALAAWERLIVAHGGDPDPDRLARPERVIEIPAPTSGWVQSVAAEELGWVAVETGAGRRTRSELIDPAGGVRVHKRIGDRVEAGEALAGLELGRRPVDEERLSARIAGAFELADEAIDPPRLTLGTVDQESVISKEEE